MSMSHLEIRNPSIPGGLLDALEREREICRLHYTRPQMVYYCVEPDYRQVYVGVWGDGSMGAYEWFIWNADTKVLQTSDRGYGCIGVALCHGLVESGAHTANGDHDLVLTWKRDDRGTSPE